MSYSLSSFSPLFGKRRVLIFLFIFVFLLVLSVFFLQRRSSYSPSFDGGPVQRIEREDAYPDFRKETLPDGKHIEYGTYHGPFTEERIDLFQKLLERRESRQQERSSVHIVSAADPTDFLVIENLANAPQSVIDRVLYVFQSNGLMWTMPDLQALVGIVVVASESDINGALGLYDFRVETDESGNFSDWLGLIYIVATGPIEVSLSHEYGHHFTNYWSSHRTAGSWNSWPNTDAGNYYLLRPLPDVCHCTDVNCPYSLRDWEIIAEDYRVTVTRYNTWHIFAPRTCRDGYSTVGYPDQGPTAEYLRYLPIGAPATIPSGITPFLAPSPTPVPGGEPGTDVSASASIFPVHPFVECFRSGGVCTFRAACPLGQGAQFESGKSCPSTEGCCTFPLEQHHFPGVVPTLSACELGKGVCVSSLVCISADGQREGENGCWSGAECCTFPDLSETYTNKDYRDVMRRYNEGSISSLALSSWLSRACRNPRLQIVTCDPTIGECARPNCLQE